MKVALRSVLARRAATLLFLCVVAVALSACAVYASAPPLPYQHDHHYTPHHYNGEGYYNGRGYYNGHRYHDPRQGEGPYSH